MISYTEYRTKVHNTKQNRINGDFFYALNRNISARLSYSIIRLFPRVRPNHVSVSLIIILLMVIASNIFYYYLSVNFYLVITQFVLIQILVLGDRIDGEIARYQSHFTQAGIYYDRLFHFLYPFALYFSLGYFFAISSGLSAIIIMAFVISVVASLSNLLGKLRHHIKYKIELEHHEFVIQDLYDKPVQVTDYGFFARVNRYFIFMIYGWVWILYLAITVFSFFYFQIALIVYVAHTLISITILLHYLLWTYPKVGLFSKKDF